MSDPNWPDQPTGGPPPPPGGPPPPPGPPPAPGYGTPPPPPRGPGQPPAAPQPTAAPQPPGVPGYVTPPAPGQPYPPAPPTPSYAAAPGHPYTPYPPTQKKRRWPMVVAIVVIGGLAMIAGCAVLIWRLVSGPIDAANDFLADVAAEDYVAAAEHLDGSCFGPGEATPDAIRAFFGDAVVSYDLTSTSNDNNSLGEAGGTITRTGFGEQSIRFTMSKPLDDWLVCGFRIGP